MIKETGRILSPLWGLVEFLCFSTKLSPFQGFISYPDHYYQTADVWGLLVNAGIVSRAITKFYVAKGVYTPRSNRISISQFIPEDSWGHYLCAIPCLKTHLI